MATHHFADVAQQRQQQFRKLPGAVPHESASLSVGSISASVVKLLSSSASNGEFAGGSPAGCTSLRPERRDGRRLPRRSSIERRRADPRRRSRSRLRLASQFTGMWLNPNSRGSRLRIWQPWGCKSLHAHHFSATGFSGNSRPRRLKIAESRHGGSASPGSPTILRQGYGLASRRVVHREQQTGSTQDRTALGVQVSPRRPAFALSSFGSAGQFGMSTGLANRTCLLNSGLPKRGVWCESTAFRHSCSPAERSRDMREVKRQHASHPTISVVGVRQSRPTILCSRAAESPHCLENKLELSFQVHVPERVIQGPVTNHLIVFCAWTASRLGI